MQWNYCLFGFFFLHWLERKIWYVCYEAFTLNVCNPSAVRQKFYLFQKLMILFSGTWILGEVSVQQHNPVAPRKMIWKFSEYSWDKLRVIFSVKSWEKHRGKVEKGNTIWSRHHLSNSVAQWIVCCPFCLFYSLLQHNIS